MAVRMCSCSARELSSCYSVFRLGGTLRTHRFPFLVYSNGGGSFLIPYFIALILLGIPLYLLELTLGQCFKRSTLSTLRTMHWRLGGTGIAMAVEAALVSLYYNVVIAWSLYYLVQSFRSPLPWIDKGAEAYFNDSVLQMSSGGVTDVGGLVGPLVGALAVAWVSQHVQRTDTTGAPSRPSSALLTRH